MRHYGLVPDDAQQPPHTDAPMEVPLVYANRTRASGTPWDLSLDFAYVGGDSAAKHGVRVVLSWEQAAAVRDLFMQMISRYEDELGAIRTFEGEPTVEDNSASDAEGEVP